MAQRPDRRAQNTFSLGEPDVTFEHLDSRHVKITIPENSGWRFPTHWHLREETGCHRVTNLKGRLLITTATPYSTITSAHIYPPGSYLDFNLGDHHAFRSYHENEELVVLLETDESQTALYRNTCSAVLDAKLYPTLVSTPYWIRVLYWMLRSSPTAQRSFIAKLLWIQIQMMSSAHNLYSRHGKINAPYLWWLAHPWHWDTEPKWTYNIMWWSYNAISRGVQGSCYWVGRLFLGMKAEYPEYTPAQEPTKDGTVLSEKSAVDVARGDHQNES